ncbi:hypothetical protein LguiA_000705 [Lonicera macranthoides]
MYNTVYFEACTTHRLEKKDQFCIDCCISLCSNCLPIHNHRFNPPHKIVKIRRYVYCEVIKRQDLSKHFNCSGIQAYQTNKSKVIFLKQRTQQQQPQQHNNNISSNNNNSCIICQRSLPEPLSLYCSIACKVDQFLSFFLSLFFFLYKQAYMVRTNPSFCLN